MKLIEDLGPGRGLLVAFCGVDGSGKTTQLQLAQKYLDQRGQSSIILKQPTDWYRNHPETRRVLASDDGVDLHFLALFAAADRTKQAGEEIRPALAAGTHVLMDRYVFSTFAYFKARGLEGDDWLVTINSRMPLPDLTIHLDVPVEDALKRIVARDGVSSKAEEQNMARMRRVRAAFLELPAAYPIEVVDGTKPADEVHDSIVTLIEARLAWFAEAKRAEIVA